MEEVSNFFQNVMQSYGFWGCAVVIIVTILSEIVKIPLKNWADKYAKDNEVDKKVVTCWFAFIPFILSLVATFVFYSWRELHWQMDGFEWSCYLSESSVFTGLSISLYEIVNGVVKAYVAKMAKATGVDTSADSNVSSSEIMAKYRELKQQDKKKTKEEKTVAKIEKEKIERQSKLERLKKELADLENNEPAVSPISEKSDDENVI